MLILFGDPEPSIKALMDTVAGKWPHGATVQTTAVGSHASNGATERAILEIARQGRCMRSALESHFKDYRLQTTPVIFPWLIRRASWLTTRFLIKSDGKSSYQRLRGRDYHGGRRIWGGSFLFEPSTKDQ